MNPNIVEVIYKNMIQNNDNGYYWQIRLFVWTPKNSIIKIQTQQPGILCMPVSKCWKLCKEWALVVVLLEYYN